MELSLSAFATKLWLEPNQTLAWKIPNLYSRAILLTYLSIPFQDAGTQTNLLLKSITEATAESCLHHLYDALRKQTEDVDYFIIKANNLAYKCRIVPADDRDFCLASLKSLERSISMQLVHISNTLRNLTNVCIPLGTCMDGLMKLIMQHYICLKNLTKHFLNCCSGGVKVSIQGTK